MANGTTRSPKELLSSLKNVEDDLGAQLLVKAERWRSQTGL